ncbi:hypothetical protein R1flu_014248 [Riccia fluitans]|uniref:Uncharacterized protein n=1 Tax=Riccia fluitans TaxID=41844 RepID=A0ABD1YIP9_9MARC
MYGTDYWHGREPPVEGSSITPPWEESNLPAPGFCQGSGQEAVYETVQYETRVDRLYFRIMTSKRPITERSQKSKRTGGTLQGAHIIRLCEQQEECF